MRRLSDIAVNECVGELRAACRLPIEQPALDTVIGWLRPNFERILDHASGGKRWADHGQRVRDNARHLGAFADFFANHVGATIVGVDELKPAFQMIRADCTIQASIGPFSFEYCCDPDCTCNPDPCLTEEAFDVRVAEEFLRRIAPMQEPLRRAG